MAAAIVVFPFFCTRPRTEVFSEGVEAVIGVGSALEKEDGEIGVPLVDGVGEWVHLRGVNRISPRRVGIGTGVEEKPTKVSDTIDKEPALDTGHDVALSMMLVRSFFESRIDMRLFWASHWSGDRPNLSGESTLAP